MVFLGEMWTSDCRARVKVNSLDIKVKSKLPHCVIGIEVNFGHEYGSYNETQPGSNVRTHHVEAEIEPWVLQGSVDGVPVFESNLLSSRSISINRNPKVMFDYLLRPEAIQYIESRRSDDVDILLTLIGRYSEKPIDMSSPTFQGTLHIAFNKDFSHKIWNRIMREIGYSDTWIIAIERPAVEGYHEVLEFLNKAKDGLQDNDSPDAILSNLRSAWDCLDPYIKKYGENIQKQLNAGSKVEVGQPNKDVRVASIRDSVLNTIRSITDLTKSIDKLTQIGPHREWYQSTRDDALLAYRLTVSLMSYYSKFLKSSSEEKRRE